MDKYQLLLTISRVFVYYCSGIQRIVFGPCTPVRNTRRPRLCSCWWVNLRARQTGDRQTDRQTDRHMHTRPTYLRFLDVPAYYM